MATDRIRARLRQLRFERGLSVRALADASGLAASTVSRLETGARRLTLEHLVALAGGLGVPVDALFARGDPAPARDGKLWEPVGPERTTGARVYRVGLAPGEPALHSHEGHQWIYVLQGRARLVLEHHDLVLDEGQACEFNTWRPHWLGAADAAAELLVIFSPEGRAFDVLSPP